MRRLAGIGLMACAAIAPAAASAQGFGVYELSTCAMSRGGATGANPCADGSAIFFNPAGVAALAGTHLSAGVTLIAPSGGFTDDIFQQHTNMSSLTFFVPNVFVTRRVNDKLGVGIGLYAPYGLGTKWPTTFAGRFSGYDTQLKSFYIQPTVAYQVTPKLSLGLGVAYIHSTVALHQRLDLSQQIAPVPLVPVAGLTFASLGIPLGTDFADADLSASGNGVAFNGGFTYKLTDRLTIGGHFLTKKTIHYTGNASFTQVATGLVLPAGFTPLNPSTPLPVDNVLASEFAAGGPLSAGGASTDITLPDQGSFGFSYAVTERWDVSADWQRVVWGWFSKLQVTFANSLTPALVAKESYHDTDGFRFGTEYRYTKQLTIRAGYLHHDGASPDETVTPRLPEGTRNEFVAGAGIELGGGLHADLAYQYVSQNDRRGRVSDVSTVNTGLYTFHAHLFGAGLSYSF